MTDQPRAASLDDEFRAYLEWCIEAGERALRDDRARSFAHDVVEKAKLLLGKPL